MTLSAVPTEYLRIVPADPQFPLPPIFANLRLVEDPQAPPPEVQIITVPAPAIPTLLALPGGYAQYPGSLFPGQVDVIREQPHPQLPDAVMALETYVLGGGIWTQPLPPITSNNNITLTAPAAFIGNGAVPPGGAAGYVLTKNTATSYDYVWAPAAGGGGGITLPLGQNLTFSPDNTYDVGSAPSNRPRDLNLARNAVVGQNLNVTGTTTLAALTSQAASVTSLTASSTATITGLLTANGGVQGTLNTASQPNVDHNSLLNLPTGNPHPQYLTQTTADTRYVLLGGSVMTGFLTLNANPTLNLQAAPKQYVDTTVAAYLPLAGGTLTGPLTLSADPTANLQAATKQYVDAHGVSFPLYAPNGTSSAPSYSFAADHTLGVYSTGAGLLGLSGAVAIGPNATPNAIFQLLSRSATADTTTYPLVLRDGNGTNLMWVRGDGAGYFLGNFNFAGTATGNGTVPPGGTVNQVLAKSAGTDYSLQWSTPPPPASAPILVYEAQAQSGTTLSLPFTPPLNGVTNVSVNGQVLMQTRDWTITGSSLTFTTALTADDVHVEYVAAASFTNANYAVHYEATLSPGTTQINLPSTPVGTPLLSRGGVVQYQSAGHYSISTATITLAQPIISTEDGRVSCDYFVAGGGASDAGSVNGQQATPATNPQPNKLVATDSTGKLPASIVPAIANLLVNGGFEVWQRGNGPFTGAGGGFHADRWQIYMQGTDTISVTKDTAASDIAMGSNTAAACAFTLGNGGGVSSIYQVLMINEQGLQGRTVSASVRVYTSFANAVRIDLQRNDGTQVFSSYHSGNGQYQTLSVTMTNVPTNATSVVLHVYFSASGTHHIDNAMLVVGSTPADYQPLHPADDLARCLRYYEQLGSSYFDAIGAGVATATTQVLIVGAFKAQKAVSPTVTQAAGGWQVFTNGSWANPSAATTAGITVRSALLQLTPAQNATVNQAAVGTGSGSGIAVIAEANP